MAHAPQAALIDSIIGCRRGFSHALGARAERDEYALCGPGSVHFCVPRGGICHGDCGDRCVCTVSGWKVSSNLPGAIVRVWKGLGTRVGAHGDRPGVVREKSFYVKAIYQINERREVPISTEVAVNAIPKGIPPASRIGAQLPEVTGRNIPGFARRNPSWSSTCSSRADRIF